MANIKNQPDLVFDLGMHRGLDSRFYLDKGFKVVALEANPYLVETAKKSFAKDIDQGRLTIVDRALWSSSDKQISFYLNKEKDDWSSAFKAWAEKGGHTSTEIKVATIALTEIFDAYGVPYYIKCDVEGADDLFCRQLLSDFRRPSFVSVEAISLEVLAILYSAGYDRVQIVNQALNPFVSPPNPPKEGRHVAVGFTGHMSGLFGKELDPKRWTTFSQAAENYLTYERLRNRDEQLAHGWLDFHVTSADFLAQQSTK